MRLSGNRVGMFHYFSFEIVGDYFDGKDCWISLQDFSSTLSSSFIINYKINKTPVNLTNLAYKRLEICQKLYIEEKDKENIQKV